MTDKTPRNRITPEEALAYHMEPRPGKFDVVPSTPMATQRDLSLAYSPGVAVPVQAIADLLTPLDRAIRNIRVLVRRSGVAIREGVKKSLEATEQHFFEQYGKRVNAFVYDSDRLNVLATVGSSRVATSAGSATSAALRPPVSDVSRPRTKTVQSPPEASQAP